MLKLFITSFLLILTFTSVSFAYLGPGMGGGIILATLGVIIAIFASLFAIIWYPLRKLLKKKNKKLKKNKIDN